MFAIGMAILWVIVMVYYGASERHRENKNRNQAISKGRDWYLDRNGLQHKTDTREPFVVRTDFKTGHKIQVNPYTGKVMRDVTAESVDFYELKGKSTAIQEGNEFYEFETPTKISNRKNDLWTKINRYNDGPLGVRYKRINDNQIYVKRKPDGLKAEKKAGENIYTTIWFYLNVDTGFFDYYDASCLDNDRKFHYKHDKSEFDGYLTRKNASLLLKLLNERQRNDILATDGSNYSPSMKKDLIRKIKFRDDWS